MEKYFEIPKDIEKIIIEISKKAKEIDLGNLEFEYSNGSNFYRISLTEFKTYWQVVHRGEFNLSDRADIYKLSFDGVLEFDWSEHD